MSAEPTPRRLPDPLLIGAAILVAAVVLWRYVPGADSFVEPKWALWKALLAAVLGLAVLLAIRGRAVWLIATPTAIALLACIAWAELSTHWASSPLNARLAIGSWWAMLWTLLLVQHLIWTAPRGSSRWTLPALVLLIAAVALWALLEDFGIGTEGTVSRLGDWRGALSASLGNSGHIADLCAFGLLLALLIVGYAKRRVPLLGGLLGCVIVAAAMVVCFSFHSNLALIGGALIALLGLGRRRLRRLAFARWRRFAFLGLLWGTMLAFYLTDTPGNPHRPGIARQALGSERLAWGWGSRLLIWSNSLEMVRIHPWLGWGCGSFSHGYPQQSSVWVIDNPDPRIAWGAGGFTNAAHNAPLQIWAEMGIVGLALWVLLFALHFQACFRLMRHPRRRMRVLGLWLAAMTVMWLLQAQMNFRLQMPVGRLTLVLLLAVASGLDARSRHASVSRLAIPLVTRLTGWRFAIAIALTAALVSHHLWQAAVRHEVQRRHGVSYEVGRLYNGQRDAMHRTGASAAQLATWSDSDIAWEGVDAAQDVLRLDPDFMDTRSGFHGHLFSMGHDMLLAARSGLADEATSAHWHQQGERLLRASIEQGNIALAGQQDAPRFRNLALAHELLGEIDEARRHWVTYFQRRPAAMQTPDFERWSRDPEFQRQMRAQTGID